MNYIPNRVKCVELWGIVGNCGVFVSDCIWIAYHCILLHLYCFLLHLGKITIHYNELQCICNNLFAIKGITLQYIVIHWQYITNTLQYIVFNCNTLAIWLQIDCLDCNVLWYILLIDCKYIEMTTKCIAILYCQWHCNVLWYINVVKKNTKKGLGRGVGFRHSHFNASTSRYPTQWNHI